MKKFRCAVIGCGNISRRHTDALSSSDRAELVCVCDIDEVRAKAAGEKYGVEWCCDWQELLMRTDIDSIHICTPHYLHAPMAIAAMKAGKHVFTEKPLATTLPDAEEMIRVSEETGKYLGVCFQNRYKPANIRLRQAVTSGQYGKVLGARGIVNWYRTPEYYTKSDWRGAWATEGGGVLINQSIHTLDLLLCTMGDPVRVEAACGTWALSDTIEVEDTANALLSFPDGTSALFFASNCYAENAGVQFEVVCEEAVLSAGEDFFTVRTKSGESLCERADANVKDEKDYWGNCHHLIIDDYYRCIERALPFPVDGRQGIRTLKTIDAIYRSAHFGPYQK